MALHPEWHLAGRCRLPPEYTAALVTAQSVLGAVEALLGPKGELVGSVERLDGIIGTLNTVLGAVSTALNLVYIPSAGAARAHYQQVPSHPPPALHAAPTLTAPR